MPRWLDNSVMSRIVVSPFRQEIIRQKALRFLPYFFLVGIVVGIKLKKEKALTIFIVRA